MCLIVVSGLANENLFRDVQKFATYVHVSLRAGKLFQFFNA